MPDDEADAAYSAACSWMFGTSAVASSAAALPPAVLGTNRHDQNDFRHPANEFHAAGQKLRGRIGMVLRNREYIREFKREDIPTPQRSPTTHLRLTALLKNRDRVEEDLYLLHCDTDANGAPADPKRDIEPEYKRLCAKLNDINRNMFQVYMDHLAPFEVDTEPSIIENSASTTQSRVFRQGVQGNTADKNKKQTSSQSSSTNEVFVRKQDAQTTFLQPEKTSSQLKSSENLFFPHTAQTKKTPGQINPSVRVPSLGQGLSRSSEAIRQAMDHTSEPSPPAIARGKRRAQNKTAVSPESTANNASDCPNDKPEPPPTEPGRRHSSRPPSTKRVRYEPEAMGQGPRKASGMSVSQHHRPGSRQNHRRHGCLPHFVPRTRFIAAHQYPNVSSQCSPIRHPYGRKRGDTAIDRSGHAEPSNGHGRGVHLSG